jgi:hypothetical protein
MSEPRNAASAASPPQPSLIEVDGRIAEIEAQRSMAQNRCVVLAGRVAELLDLLKIQRAENERLAGLLADREDSALAAHADTATAH